ncbi:hypothetical protein BDV25DRAFT_29000 [Aspergillus avenaceus]|uniref:Uncharacterized protein n=1 Tax=Aspergillus avenaceus TaxID=36643 RepID=A0A5N6TMU2_ASPAV|nr:hypothetical protein BDV25DRAFT_29000 [Aspergillus avenaceus]
MDSISRFTLCHGQSCVSDIPTKAISGKGPDPRGWDMFDIGAENSSVSRGKPTTVASGRQIDYVY